jgi:hypothetical protein
MSVMTPEPPPELEAPELPEEEAAPEAPPAPVEEVVLDSTHRCDKCHSQAYWRAEFTEGGFLEFCNHHWVAFKEMIEPLTSHIVDESHRLIEGNRKQGSAN